MVRWNKKDSRKIADSTFFTLKEDDIILPNGNKMTYTMLDMPDFAGVLPVIDDKFVLIKNYRYPVDEMVLEIPAGLVEEGEEPEETAVRELEEETGYKLKSCEKLVEYHPTASLNTQTAHLFFGEVEEGGKRDRDEMEHIEVEVIPISEVYEMLDRKEISHPHTMIALFYSKNKLSEGIFPQ